MRIRVRGPAGQSTVTLDDTATVNDLRAHIVEKTGLTAYDVKYGYPDLKPLVLDGFPSEQKIRDLGISLNGEQLLVTRKEDSAPTSLPQAPSARDSQRPVSTAQDDDDGKVSLTRKAHEGSAIMGGMDTMTELRSIVAQTIQANPDVYSEAVLEKKADDYCRWIQQENSWGGAIELSILSKHFDIEICSIDVQTLRVDRFNEGPPTRCVLVYSGIHYDTIALSPSDPPYTHAYAPPEFDTKVFDAADPVVLEKALALCEILQRKHYYTDTAGFRIRCNTCGGIFIGEKGATTHATQTGHYNFGEAS
ncbi:ubiquitin-specific protease otu1 [Aspergillus fumigatus]